MKRVAILQSNYLPWKGYFDLINSVDLFIFHDDLQYTKGDWRNRNKIVTPSGSQWIGIPVGTSEKRLICEVEIKDHAWQRDHFNRICENYRKAPYFKNYIGFFEELYLGKTWTNLSDLNQYLIQQISTQLLNIRTHFGDSREYKLTTRKEQRVLDLLSLTGATTYLSGPAAKSYLHDGNFQHFGIKLEWMNYEGYKSYKQQFNNEFEHGVSIVDLLMNVGPEYSEYMISYR